MTAGLTQPGIRQGRICCDRYGLIMTRQPQETTQMLKLVEFDENNLLI